MTERKNDVLNVRLSDTLAREIERIAAGSGVSGSEAARQLLEYGVMVERRIEAQELSRHYSADRFDRSKGYVTVDAKFVRYTNRELQEIEDGPDVDVYGDLVE